MSITIPKPDLLRFKVPGTLTVGLLIAQFIFFQYGSGPDPKCTLRVEKPHYSTSLHEIRRIEAIKLNMTVACNVPQKYTEVTSEIKKIDKNKEVTAHQFQIVRRVPKVKNPNIVVMQDLYIKCLKGVWDAYKGEAKGYVLLKNNQKYRVQGNSGNYIAVDCAVGAQ